MNGTQEPTENGTQEIISRNIMKQMKDNGLHHDGNDEERYREVSIYLFVSLSIFVFFNISIQSSNPSN